MSLLELCAEAVGRSCAVEEILAWIPFLPKAASQRIWRHMPPVRLRELEICVIESAPDLAVLDEFERQWEAWTEADACVVFDGHESSRYFGNEHVFILSSTLNLPRSFRALYWERVFRMMLATTPTPSTPLRLFQEVVCEVKLRGGEVTQANLQRLLMLTALHRIEIHHAVENESFWTHVATLVQHAATLREICILHSKLSTIRPLVTAIGARCHAPIAMVEFVSVTLRQSAFTDLVTFVESKLVAGIRLTNSIPDDADASAILLPALQGLDSVLIEHHDFEDLVIASEALAAPSSATRLSLGSNAISDVSFLSRCVHLVELDVSHNDLRDAGIAALATACLPAMPALTKLFVVNCHFSSTGAAALFSSLASSPASVRVINAGRNFFGSSIQDEVLAPFLSSCPALQCLHLNYIGIGSTVSPAFGASLAQHPSLTQLSLGENRLRDEGAAAVFASLPFPMQAVDLSGNLVTRHGLDSLATHVRSARPAAASPPSRRRRLAPDERCLVEELNLRDNLFDASDLRSTLAPLDDALPVVYANEWRHQAVAPYDDQLV